MTAVLLAGVVGGPISGALLQLDGAGGIRGWQWLFLIEGVPAIVLGVVVMFVLKEGPADAVWLVPSERAALIAALEQEQHRAVDHSLSTVIRHGCTWLLAASTSPFR